MMLLWVAALGLPLYLAMYRSSEDVRTYGGVDLRPKIAGALRFFGGRSPYFNWLDKVPDGVSDNWIDPQSIAEISRCTYPPTLLLIYRIGANVEYRLLRYGWAVVEWGLMLLAILLVTRTAATGLEKAVTATVGVWFFACSAFFRLHVERGQYYILVTFAWALAWFLARRRGPDSWLVGLTLGTAVAIRPTIAVILVPLWFFGWYRTCGGFAVSISAWISATLPIGGFRSWLEFGRLAHFYRMSIAGLVPYLTEAPDRVVFSGYDLTKMLVFPTENATVLGTLRGLEEQLHIQPYRAHYLALSTIIVAGLLIGWLIVVYVWSRQPVMPRNGMLCVFVTAIIADLASPMRWSYVEVMYLVPLVLSIPKLVRLLESGGSAVWVTALVAVALFLGVGLGELPWPVPTMIRTSILLAVFAIAALYQRQAPPVYAPEYQTGGSE